MAPGLSWRELAEQAVRDQKTSLKLSLLRPCGVPESEYNSFCDFLSVDSTLTELHLRSNMLGDTGMANLAETLKQNNTLQKLFLSGNDIKEEGAQALALALQENSGLQQLYLSVNAIDNAGAMQLSEAIATNTCLQVLYLNHNCIDDEGAQSLADALRRNGVLEELCLGGNDIKDEKVLNKIQRLLKRNKSGLGPAPGEEPPDADSDGDAAKDEHEDGSATDEASVDEATVKAAQEEAERKEREAKIMEQLNKFKTAQLNTSDDLAARDGRLGRMLRKQMQQDGKQKNTDEDEESIGLEQDSEEPCSESSETAKFSKMQEPQVEADENHELADEANADIPEVSDEVESTADIVVVGADTNGSPTSLTNADVDGVVVGNADVGGVVVGSVADSASPEETIAEEAKKASTNELDDLRKLQRERYEAAQRASAEAEVDGSEQELNIDEAGAVQPVVDEKQKEKELMMQMIERLEKGERDVPVEARNSPLAPQLPSKKSVAMPSSSPAPVTDVEDDVPPPPAALDPLDDLPPPNTVPPANLLDDLPP